MSWFYDLKIASRLVAGFIAVLLLTVFLGLFSIEVLADVNEKSSEIEANWLPSARYTACRRCGGTPVWCPRIATTNTPVKSLQLKK